MSGIRIARDFAMIVLLAALTACETPSRPAMDIGGGPLSRLPDTTPATNQGERRAESSQTIQDARQGRELTETVR